MTVTIKAVKEIKDQSIFVWMPKRIENPKVLSGKEFDPVATDDFLMILKANCAAGKSIVVIVGKLEKQF